ncbi:MAG TPA: sigma-70 family RNA polymerase sigma factor [Leptolinea sp.]
MAETILYQVDDNCSIDEFPDLIQEAQANLIGFKHLYQHWLSPVYRYFYSRIENKKDAEDLTAQVFLKVYEELPHYHERGQFSAWLFTIVRNQAMDYFRSGSREVSLEIIDPAGETRDLLSQAVRSDEIKRLHHLIQTLPEDEQELIRLRFVVKLGYQEIGVVVNRKEDAVRKSITRLLARMESQLEISHE